MSKLLIVEDEQTIAQMYEFKLKQQGYDVMIALNGQQGLDLAESFKPDLILLDVRMPVMTGDEMLGKMRQTDWGASIRVIVLTNISKDEAPQSLRLLHVDRYVVKAHTTPSQVVTLVSDIVGK